MTTLKQITNREERRKLKKGLGTTLDETIGKQPNGFFDHNNVNPRKASQSKSTVTPPVDADLSYYGMNVPSTVKTGNKSNQGQTYRFNTPGGHIIEYNDTPDQERILIKHKSGSGINIGPDGSVIVSATERVDVISENHTLSVGNDGVLSYDGSLTLKVAGDFNVEVGGEYNIKSSQSSVVTRGDYNRTTYGNYTNEIDGNKTEFIDGINTQTTSQESYIQSKGTYNLATENEMIIASKGLFRSTSETEIDVSSPSINIAAQKLNVIGNTGTIGGENIIMYNYNLYVGHTAYIESSLEVPYAIINRVDGTSAHYTTFHGDLTGTAAKSQSTSSQNYGEGVTKGTPYTLTNTSGKIVPFDDKKTSEPNNGILSDYLNKSNKGILSVQIDPGSIYQQGIDMTTKNGGISNRILNEDEARQQLRDPLNRENDEFIGQILTNGTLSTDIARKGPERISYIKSIENPTIRGQIPIGNIEVHKVSKKIKGGLDG